MKETLPHIRGYLSEMTHLNSPVVSGRPGIVERWPVIVRR
ncbi:hypothetical protein SLI_2695 [Streptomyces lividans 1326]|uniref:Uncharacterized protein n=1 Tax=Streptomyces lividans 1326 TaxID=1200984 RepID=A0A7U9HAL2_STRLI|nr:hypothetical protein SLI_2695 [Streptomyces lividans 1326]